MTTGGSDNVRALFSVFSSAVCRTVATARDAFMRARHSCRRARRSALRGAAAGMRRRSACRGAASCRRAATSPPLRSRARFTARVPAFRSMSAHCSPSASPSRNPSAIPTDTMAPWRCPFATSSRVRASVGVQRLNLPRDMRRGIGERRRVLRDDAGFQRLVERDAQDGPRIADRARRRARAPDADRTTLRPDRPSAARAESCRAPGCRCSRTACSYVSQARGRRRLFLCSSHRRRNCSTVCRSSETTWPCCTARSRRCSLLATSLRVARRYFCGAVAHPPTPDPPGPSTGHWPAA